MKLSERIATLARLGVYPKTIKGDKEAGEVIARFDDGEGIEYITVGGEGIESTFANEPLYQVLVAELGKIDAQKIRDRREGVIKVETHHIKDFRGNIEYQFLLPSREYVKNSS